MQSTDVRSDHDAVSTESSALDLMTDPLEDYLLGLAVDLTDVDVPGLVERLRRSSPAGTTLDTLKSEAIHLAAGLTFEEPQYSRLASGILAESIQVEVAAPGATSFSASVRLGHAQGLINERVMALLERWHVQLDGAIRPQRDADFEYFGLRTVRDRYLIRHPTTRAPIETPQYFFMRVALGVSDKLTDALELYEAFSTHVYLPSSPTLFNAATTREQLSSCFLLDSPQDDLRDIYKRYADIAMLSKFAGGIGLAYSRVRSDGSHIKGTNGQSRGIVPFLNTLDASVAAVNQGGRRKGACSVYLEPWHPDIESFLELRDNTGDEARRTHNLNLANWIPDIFMRRVEANQMWSLIDPKQVPELVDTYGPAFDALYEKAEAEGRVIRQVKARDLYGRMMRTLAQTGNGWMCFKDASNRTCNQAAQPENVVHLSNLCTEIIEVTNKDETAVCNLGSINLSKHVTDEGVDYEMLAETTRRAVRQLDRVIDRNLYTIPETSRSNMKWRPVGLGMMGLQDVFFRLRVAFDSAEARELNLRIAETIYFHAVKASVELAQELGPHSSFSQTWAARGKLQPDLWGRTPVTTHLDWDGLRKDVVAKGMRNSLLMAIAPTATIASILGCYECIEPAVSNLFKRETLSGEFLQVNRFLVRDLKDRGLWTADIRDQVKVGRGSIQHIAEVPADMKDLYRTAWELSMRCVVDLASDRGAYIDQSQSLNLFAEQPSIGRLSSMYMYAWKSGLKTTYYMRSRPATQINMATSTSRAATPVTSGQTYTEAEKMACSLENPDYCEACQ